MSFRLPNNHKQDIKEKIIEYFYRERGEEIGDLAAENFFHFLNEDVGVYFYNQGIQDAKSMVEQKMMGLEEDLESLRKLPKR
ncbi:MAG: DUF2164 domain-containing protein [Bacillaceae bacterium]|nr:DUF2164 domain-containing protein [Bacillaceae bacterium]